VNELVEIGWVDFIIRRDIVTVNGVGGCVVVIDGFGGSVVIIDGFGGRFTVLIVVRYTVAIVWRVLIVSWHSVAVM
jgi:hypothetical protein